jgi:hypothetical protein
LGMFKPLRPCFLDILYLLSPSKMEFEKILIVKVLRVHLLFDSYTFARENYLPFGLTTVDDLLGVHSWRCFTRGLD